MAVQAQYPSNILLLNRNNQEGHDYSLQPQPGGVGVLEQSHLLFNNGGSNNNNNNNNINSRKRGREVVSSSTATATNLIINPFSYNQSSHLIDHLPHLINQSNVVSTGLRLSSGDQQNQNQNHHHHQQNNLIISQSSAFLSLFSQDFASHIKQQRDEIDQFLQAQEEQLRRTLAEKRQRHYRELLGAAEESAVMRLREKEAEVEKATRRNAELEARAARLSMEAQAWQAKARAQEATAATLQAQLQQAIMRGGDGGGGDCTVVGEGQAEDAESAHVDPDRVEPAAEGPSCKGCRKRAASVVVLPCRHFCLCTECDQFVQVCPLCRASRNSSVEVFLS